MLVRENRSQHIPTMAARTRRQTIDRRARFVRHSLALEPPAMPIQLVYGPRLSASANDAAP
jgi:hypothetical protein